MVTAARVGLICPFVARRRIFLGSNNGRISRGVFAFSNSSRVLKAVKLSSRVRPQSILRPFWTVHRGEGYKGKVEAYFEKFECQMIKGFSSEGGRLQKCVHSSL